MSTKDHDLTVDHAAAAAFLAKQPLDRSSANQRRDGDFCTAFAWFDKGEMGERGALSSEVMRNQRDNAALLSSSSPH